MAITFYPALMSFFISLLISAIVIYVATKLLGETEGFGTALLAAFFGSLIYSIAYYYMPLGAFASILAGLVWLIALGMLYNIGWIKALLIAVVTWALALLVGVFLPTVAGPL